MKKIILSLALTLSAEATHGAEGKTSSRHNRDLSIVITDVVRRLEPSEENYRVVFKKHAATYLLKKETKDFDIIMKILSTSQMTKQKVQLRIDPNSLEIKSSAK